MLFDSVQNYVTRLDQDVILFTAYVSPRMLWRIFVQVSFLEKLDVMRFHFTGTVMGLVSFNVHDDTKSGSPGCFTLETRRDTFHHAEKERRWVCILVWTTLLVKMEHCAYHYVETVKRDYCRSTCTMLCGYRTRIRFTEVWSRAEC